jgi:penicillin-binding protein 2
MSVFNQSRQTVVRFIFAAVFFVIIARLFTLQVISGKYQKLAQDNALLREVVYPNRGIIFDRKGRAILDNTIMYDLMVTPMQVKGLDTMALCRILGIDTSEFRQRIINAIVKNGRSRPSIFESLLSPEKLARISESLFKFQPAFNLQERPVRTYPFHTAGVLLGYVGEVDSAFIRRHVDQGYQSGDYAGRTGLESAYERELMGQRGVRFLVKDNLNRPQGPYAGGQYDTAAIAGKNLYTSIDVDLQQYGEKLMAGKVGSIVAIDPKTGGILAMVSSPTFDPNDLTGPDRNKHLSEMLRDPALPMYDRAILATYPPGSTFKPLDAMVALDEGVITPSYGVNCLGWYYDCGTPRKCLEKAPGHGRNLVLGITNSCNSYFFSVFRLIVDQHHNVEDGLMQWKAYMNSFGLGRRLGVDLPGENSGYIPDTAHYNKVFGRHRWNSCTAVSLGIGQGETIETPMQIANTMCLIGNRGYYYIPHIVDSVSGGDTVLDKYRVRHEPTHIPLDIFQKVIEGMYGVVQEGTAQAAQVPGIAIAGKTGTAQNFYHGVAQKDHALFAAFAPKDDPKIAIAVVCENSGMGGNSAAPIAGLMIEKYLNDTIMESRKAIEQRILTLDLIPPRIYAERDSLAKERARELADTLGEDDSIPPPPKHDSTPPKRDTTVRRHVAEMLAPDNKKRKSRPLV